MWIYLLPVLMDIRIPALKKALRHNLQSQIALSNSTGMPVTFNEDVCVCVC